MRRLELVERGAEGALGVSKKRCGRCRRRPQAWWWIPSMAFSGPPPTMSTRRAPAADGASMGCATIVGAAKVGKRRLGRAEREVEGAEARSAAPPRKSRVKAARTILPDVVR